MFGLAVSFFYRHCSNREFHREVEFLRHVVSPEDSDHENARAVGDWPQATTVTDVCSFLGLKAYYQRFIEGLVARTARPLKQVTEKENFRQYCESLISGT